MKKIENIIITNHTNCICHRERRFNNEKNGVYIFRNARQKNEYNNHRFYSNNEKDDNNIINLSEMYSKTKNLEFYKSNSKSKNKENIRNNNLRLSFKTKNHNFHNINTTTYHSYDKKKKFEKDTYNIKNINLIKIKESEINTPRTNNEAKCFVYQKNCNDLFKTLNNFKNRDNCGYHEIKDVKKNKTNQNINKNNAERKKVNNNLSTYPSINISNNISFRRSLIMNNNIYNASDINSDVKSNNSHKNEINNKADEVNKNRTIRKYSYLNFKNNQNYCNSPKDVGVEENNFSSYRNIKEIPKKNIKEEKKNRENNKNIDKSLLIRKIYMNTNPEEKKRKYIEESNSNFIKRNDLKNNNPYFNINENDKKLINSKMILSGDLKEIIKDVKNEKSIIKIYNNNKNKLNNLNGSNIKIKKMYSPIKKENITNINHIKKNTYTEKLIPNRNEKYEINHIFKKVENKIFSNQKNKKENEKNTLIELLKNN